jgi:hypothetical protein
MAHYSSEKKHFVVNESDEEAEMLVIRFYGEGSDRTTKGHGSAEAKTTDVEVIRRRHGEPVTA